MQVVVFIVLITNMVYGFSRPPYAIGSFIVEPKEEKITELEKFTEQRGMKLRKISPYLKACVVSYNPNLNWSEIRAAQGEKNYEKLLELYWRSVDELLEYIAIFKQSGLVNYAQPNHLFYAQYTPNDPYFTDDGNYTPRGNPDQYWAFILRTPQGWDITTGNENIILAILDSGTDIDHPDLIDNIWVNPGEDINRNGLVYDTLDLDGIDNDGNGYVDDLNGYDFVGGQRGLLFGDLPESSEDWNPDIHYYYDDGFGVPDPSVGDGLDMFGTPGSILLPADMGVGHGTHTAGIAGAVMNNNLLFAGACGHCKLMIVRALTPEGTGNESDIAAGIAYASINGANVLSLSLGDLGFGGEIPRAIQEAIDLAYSRGVSIVAASGNNGTRGLSYPASSPKTLAVGSANSRRIRSSFSQYGVGLDVLGVGGEANLSTGQYTEVIWSTWVASIAEARDSGLVAGEHYIKGTAGTSMACPQVAGLAALILSLNPNLSPDSVYNIIRSTAQDISPSGWDEQTGYGIADFGQALRAAGISDNQTAKKSFTIGTPYPNPANLEAHIPIQIKAPSEIAFKLIDTNGHIADIYRLAYSKQGEYIIRFKLDNLHSGVYLLLCETGKNLETRKIVVIK